MHIFDVGKGVKIRMTQMEVRTLRDKRYIIERAARNVDGPLGGRLLQAAIAIEDFEKAHPQNTDTLDRQDAETPDRPVEPASPYEAVTDEGLFGGVM